MKYKSITLQKVILKSQTPHIVLEFYKELGDGDYSAFPAPYNMELFIKFLSKIIVLIIFS
tara:strand:+ start:1958 stop:2137 length:180 start_codon:yes stop_codon:yes gene_type:complete